MMIAEYDKEVIEYLKNCCYKYDDSDLERLLKKYDAGNGKAYDKMEELAGDCRDECEYFEGWAQDLAEEIRSYLEEQKISQITTNTNVQKSSNVTTSKNNSSTPKNSTTPNAAKSSSEMMTLKIPLPLQSAINAAAGLEGKTANEYIIEILMAKFRNNN